MTTNINLPQGYKLIANYNDEIVLAKSLNEENPEPYVTWMVHDSGLHTGFYFRELPQAQRSFTERAFGMSEIMADSNYSIDELAPLIADALAVISNTAEKESIMRAKQKDRQRNPPRNVYVDTSNEIIFSNKEHTNCISVDTICSKKLPSSTLIKWTERLALKIYNHG